MDAANEFADTYIEAIRALAESDADALAELLRSIHLLSPPKPLHLPAETLLGLGLALRIQTWEMAGITAHLDAGLPSADELKAFICKHLAGPELRIVVGALSAQVVVLLCREIAWQSSVERQGDFGLVVTDDDGFLEAMADFIWDNRQALIKQGARS